MRASDFGPRAKGTRLGGFAGKGRRLGAEGGVLQHGKAAFAVFFSTGVFFVGFLKDTNGTMATTGSPCFDTFWREMVSARGKCLGGQRASRLHRYRVET